MSGAVVEPWLFCYDVGEVIVKKRIVKSLYGLVEGELAAGEKSSSSLYPYILAGLESFSYLSGFSLMKKLEDYSKDFCFDGATRRALQAFREGVHPEACGSYWNNGSQGLYRVWPLAVYCIKKFDLRRDRNRALELTRRMLAISHRDEVSLALSRIYSQLLWQGFRGEELDIEGARAILDKLSSEPRLRRVNLAGLELFSRVLDILEEAPSYEKGLKLALSDRENRALRAGLVGSLLVFIYDREDFVIDSKIKKEITSGLLRAWWV